MSKYQPSNGTEGVWFTDKYCMQCRHCDPDPEGKKQCDILLRSMIHGVDDEEYPVEWVYGEDGEPMCTKWQQWDWEANGDPDSPKRAARVIPYNPNQLLLFSDYE